jgi:predicted oxidoreductase
LDFWFLLGRFGLLGYFACQYMKTIPIGKSALSSSRLAYGCWRLAGTWNPAEVTQERTEAGYQAVHAAFEAGYTFYDQADVYCQGVTETIFGQALKQVPGMRERIVIASKCGIRLANDTGPEAPYRYDFSADYIIQSCEQSLRRMGIETLDIYQLHRPDFLMNPEEVAHAFSQLKADGKVREFGVSNFRPSQMVLLQKYCPMPLWVNQVQISLSHLECFSDGTLDQCLADHIVPLAWSPLGGGLLGGSWITNVQDTARQRLVSLFLTLDNVAKAYAATRAQVALAWLLKHPSGIIPIIGSIQPARIQELVKADELELTREDWYRLLVTARGEKLP